MSAHDALATVLRLTRVWSSGEVLQRPCPVPACPGVYGWYFKELPYSIDTRGCVVLGDLTLLYVGISPKAPPRDGRAESQQTLRSRIRYHYRGNAEGSTLRLTLGCLLSDRLGLQLRRVGSGTRMTFVEGEHRLSAWMADNAYVTWVETPEPWAVERKLIGAVDLPPAAGAGPCRRSCAARGRQLMRVGLVGCVKTKQPRAAPAQEMSTSPLFRGRRAWVERTCDRWFILSAKHGLVEPGRVLAPYDETLTDLPRAARRSWSALILQALEQVLGEVSASSWSCTRARPTSTMGWWPDSENGVQC